MKTILTIVGARPQFVKVAPVSEAIRSYPDIRQVIVHTGQHYDTNLSDLFFNELEIPAPDYNLGIGSATHAHQTGRMLGEIEDILLFERPDVVLVYGDTNSTLAGSLAAAKVNIPIAHVEAGLRSYNRKMPEEINRVITDHLSKYLFVPTSTAEANLRREGIAPESIFVVGDVMFDSLLYFTEKSNSTSRIMEDLQLDRGEFLLATIHRAENTDDPVRLDTIVSALIELAKSKKIVLPIHPRTRKALSARSGFPPKDSQLVLLDPLGYLDILKLEKNASLIITDSGGIQKEAYFHQVPCVTLRDETEWIELIEVGWNRLVPPKSVEIIISSVEAELRKQNRPKPDLHLFGFGDAAELIGNVLCSNG